MLYNIYHTTFIAKLSNLGPGLCQDTICSLFSVNIHYSLIHFVGPGLAVFILKECLSSFTPYTDIMSFVIIYT